MDDQLSLAIGRDGQNARLAAKLTNWRIDIKSVVEAASDALHRIQSQVSMAAIAAAEAEKTGQIAEILAKKSENRPLAPEEYTLLAQFVDRVERRVVEGQKAAEQASLDKLAEVRAEVGELAFENSLDVLGLPEHVYNILTEAEYRTAGDLLLAMKLNPDKVLTLPGIGAKAIQAIEKAVAEAKFEVAVPVVEVEAPVVVEVPVEVATEAPAESESAPETVEAEVKVETPEAAVEEETETLTFEEMFKLRADAVRPADDEESADSKKKGKKGKKSVALEFDENRGEVVGRKKHKRGDGWDEEW